MKGTILNPVWLKAALFRALRTAAVIAAPYVPTLFYDQNYLLVGSAALTGFILSALTSLVRGLPETSDKSVSWYWALAERVIKTAAQALVTLMGTAVFFEDVAWAQAPQILATSILGSLLLAFMAGVPEADPPAAPAVVDTLTTNDEGVTQIAEAPVVASVEATASGSSSLSAVDTHDGRNGV